MVDNWGVGEFGRPRLVRDQETRGFKSHHPNHFGGMRMFELFDFLFMGLFIIDSDRRSCKYREEVKTVDKVVIAVMIILFAAFLVWFFWE